MFVFIRKNTNIFEKQRHLSIFLEFHKTLYYLCTRKQANVCSDGGIAQLVRASDS